MNAPAIHHLRRVWQAVVVGLFPAAMASAQPKLTLDFDVSNEGATGERRVLTFAVSLTGTPRGPATVSYAVTNGAGPGLAAATGGPACTAGIDYLANSGMLSFLPGVTRRTVAVTICGDGIHEPDERLTFTVTATMNVLVGTDSSVVGVIVNDDAKPVITVTLPNDGQVTEPTGRTATVPITISISSAEHTGAAVKLIRRGTARAAAQCTGSADLAATSDTIRVNWPAGNGDNWTVPLVICGDQTDEDNDTVELTPVVVTNADIASGSMFRRLVIFDDDPMPSLSVMDAAVVEGNVARVTIASSVASERSIDVLVTTGGQPLSPTGNSPLGGSTCTIMVDYLVVSQRIKILAGQTTATVDITTCSNLDRTVSVAALPGYSETGYSETLFVTASAPTNATIAKAVGTVTITDP